MLKAVCLDEKEHKHLIDFIEQYKDENNKANISSAIRFLMIKGYESLQQKESMQKESMQKELAQKEILQRKSLEEQQSSKNNIEEIKKEVTEQVINKLQTQLLESNSQLINVLISTLVKNKTTEQESILQQLLQLMQKQQYYQPQMQPQMSMIPFMQYQPFYQQQPQQLFANNNDQFYQQPQSHQQQQQQQQQNSIKTESKIIPNISVKSSEIAQANIKQDETGLLANLLSNANR